MKTIKVLGSGCKKCQIVYEIAQKAVTQMGLDTQVLKVDDMEEMLKYQVLTTPAIVVDDVVKLKGVVPNLEQMVQILAD